MKVLSLVRRALRAAIFQPRSLVDVTELSQKNPRVSCETISYQKIWAILNAFWN